MQLLCNRKRNGATDTAADDADLFHSVQMCCYAERTDKVADGVPRILLVECHGRCTDDLENDAYPAGFSVIAGNGQLNAFSVLVNAQNDKLPRLCFSGNERCFDIHHGDRRVQIFFLQNFIHAETLLFNGV